MQNPLCSPSSRLPTTSATSDPLPPSDDAPSTSYDGVVDDDTAPRTDLRVPLTEELAPQPPCTPKAEAWVFDFGPDRTMKKLGRKTTQKERRALLACRMRREGAPETPAMFPVKAGAESPSANPTCGGLPVVSLEGLADRNALVPIRLTTTREDLLERFVLRIPRMLCVNKQYPRSCGVSSLTSIYNYLYSWLGESPAYAHAPPHSQEEVMSVLGFEPPFGELPWGSFTGNATLIRWFYALNRHFGRPRCGRAYILYKAHGPGKTTHLYENNEAVLRAVKEALGNPRCALIYHCYNHYMVPVGYQEIPQAQTDFLKPQVAAESCDTTIFIGEVSRGRHEAIYARLWSQLVRDIECAYPYYYNIRHPEKGIQRFTGKRRAKSNPRRPGSGDDGDTAVAGVATPSPVDDEGLAAADYDRLQRELASRDGKQVKSDEDPSNVTTSENEAHVGEGGAEQPPIRYAQCSTTSTEHLLKNSNGLFPPLSPQPQAAAFTTETNTSQGGQRICAPRASRNMHCLILFRNDEEEPCPELYEHSHPGDSEEGSDADEGVPSGDSEKDYGGT